MSDATTSRPVSRYPAVQRRRNLASRWVVAAAVLGAAQISAGIAWGIHSVAFLLIDGAWVGAAAIAYGHCRWAAGYQAGRDGRG